jgi:hypothetical protein
MSTGTGRYYCFFCNGKTSEGLSVSGHTRVCFDCIDLYFRFNAGLYKYEARTAPSDPVPPHITEYAERCAQSDLRLAIRRARNGAVRVTP